MLKNFLKHLNTNNIFFLIEKFSLTVMGICIFIILFNLLTPDSWHSNILPSIYCEGGDDEIKKNFSETLENINNTLNTINNTLDNLNNNGLKHVVGLETSTDQTISKASDVLLTSTAVYAGTKIASTISNPAGKAAVIAGTVVVSETLKTINKNNQDSMFKINTSVESNNSNNSPPSPTGSDFTAFSVSEAGDTKSMIFHNIETTDALYKALNDLLTLSDLGIFFVFLMLFHFTLIFVDLEKLYFINSRPKLLNLINKSKNNRKILVVYLLFLILLCFGGLHYGLKGIIIQLLKIKTFIN